jgi:ubiquinone/menaquinone biosynthesis C-methylase UbiE
MLIKAKRRVTGCGLTNVGYAAADASTPLPYADGSFDVVTLIAVLGEVPDQVACLGHVRRVLRPKGVLAVHEHVPDPDRIKYVTLRSLAESVGFTYHKRLGPSWNYTMLFTRP